MGKYQKNLEKGPGFWETGGWLVFSLPEPLLGAFVDLPGDARLISDLLDRHGTALEFYASQWTNCPEDCVQEAFINLARQLQRPGFPPPKNITAWLYHVVRNRAKNANRAARRRIHHEQIAAQRVRERIQPAMHDVERLSLPEALDALADTDREVIVLRIWSELTWQQIAELIETSSSSAQRRYVAALEKLKNHWEPSCRPNQVCRPN